MAFTKIIALFAAIAVVSASPMPNILGDENVAAQQCGNNQVMACCDSVGSFGQCFQVPVIGGAVGNNCKSTTACCTGSPQQNGFFNFQTQCSTLGL